MSFDPQWLAPTAPERAAAPIEIVPTAAHRPPPKHRGRWLAVIATVIGLGGLGVVAYLIFGGSSATPAGASSPEQAVTSLTAALNAEDPLAAFQYVAPDEIDGVSDLLESAQQVANDQLANVGKGGDADVSFTISGVRTAPLADRAARVTFRLTGSFGASGRLAELLGGATRNVDQPEVSVIVVKIGGGWFVSPLLTAGDAAVDALELPEGDFQLIGQQQSAAKFARPEDAVDALLNGVADLDPDAVAGALSTGEARFVLVYGDAIGDLLDNAQQELARHATTYSIDRPDLVALDAGQVAVDQVTINVSGENGSAKVEINGDCAAVTSNGDRQRACALTNAPLTSPLPEKRLVLQTVKESGGYRVDLVRSFAALAEQVVTRVDRSAVMQLLDSEAADTPTQLTFNAAQQASFGGERFQVFEVEVPARTPFRIDAESNVDDSSVYADTYVMRGGRWREHYLSDGEQFDVATRVRIVVDPGCDDRDSGAMLFTCGSFARPGFVVGALADVSADVPFLGSGSLDVQPLQAVAFHFTVDHETDAMLVGTDGNGSSAYLTLGEPGVLRNDDGSYHFVPGDYTAAYSNRTADVVNVTVSFVEVQVVNVQKPSNISLDSPSTTFDLVAGQEMRLSAYVPTGESVVIRARPDGDQDIVLTVSSSRGEICGELDRGNAGGRGSSEQCRFTVSTGGNFGVVLAGVHPSDLTGTVTVTITRS